VINWVPQNFRRELRAKKKKERGSLDEITKRKNPLHDGKKNSEQRVGEFSATKENKSKPLKADMKKDLHLERFSGGRKGSDGKGRGQGERISWGKDEDTKSLDKLPPRCRKKCEKASVDRIVQEERLK